MKKNILLVDDDNIFNLINTKILQRTGYANDIHTASNGKEALNLINDYYSGLQAMPDIILLDLNMPIMDGFSFIEAFRRLQVPNKDSVAIVIVTSSADERDVKRAKDLGITHYLTKPITEKDILAILELKK